MKLRLRWSAIICMVAGQAAFGNALLQTIGNVNSANGLVGGFTNNSQVTSGSFATADSGNPSPFNGTSCGADVTANCTASWSFSSFGSVPNGQTITSATITLGIGDLDPHAGTTPVASFIVGGVDLTSLLNIAAAGGTNVCIGTGNNCYNNIYQILTVTVPSSAFATLTTGLSGGSPAVSFSTQGPGWGVLGNTTFNGVFLDFATLSVTTTAPTLTPEPGTSISLLVGLLGLAAYGGGRRFGLRGKR